ncbi:hypothetical protein HA402_004163 [Bradysia odoriphaga]|nr:hypothetical protein HA402_004163 [Bradysia odoriphaga]
METQNVEPKPARRIRKRKKQRINDIRQQMEFYFSDANLTKDRFLNQLIANDPNVPLEVFMNFNKIKNNVDSVDDIAKALLKSEFLKLSEDRRTVCRTTPIVESTNVDERTIYVESLPITTTHEWLKTCFEQYGPVAYVSLPKYRASQRIKEFAFVEFEQISSVIKTINAFKKFGGLLNMESDPENLSSIIAYLKEQQTLAEQAAQVNHTTKPKKTILTEDDGGEDVASNVDEQSETHSINLDEPPAKKVKLSEKDQRDADAKEPDEDEDQNDAGTKEHDEDDNDSEDQQDAEAKDHDEDEHDSDNKELDEHVGENHKSKNRHRKISVKNKRAANQISTPLKSVRSLRICTKIEWKKLRNKYLNEQHQQRKLFKQTFKSTKQLPPAQPLKKIVQNPRKINFYNANKEDGKEVINSKIQSIKTPLFTFAAGVIVKVFFDEPCPDIAEFKRDLRAQSYVKYIDIDEAQTAAVVRVDESRSAPTLIKHCAPKRCQILTGDNESDYWRKMEVDWKNKISKNVKVATKRGRDKLAKVIATHIRFDE